jgi:hypothetical protein
VEFLFSKDRFRFSLWCLCLIIALESLVSTLSDNSLTLSPVIKFWFDLLNLQLPVQSAPITTKVMSLNPVLDLAYQFDPVLLRIDLGLVYGVCV